MRPLRMLSSTVTWTSPTFQRANTLSVASRYDIFPPSAFVVSFARCAIAPLIPALPMFATHRTSSSPAHERYVTRPRSIVRVVPLSATSTASPMRRGMPYVRTKSQPVPRAITAISTSSSAAPFATSFTEPSPPTTTSSFAPAPAACRASSVRCPGRSEKSASPFSPRLDAS